MNNKIKVLLSLVILAMVGCGIYYSIDHLDKPRNLEEQLLTLEDPYFHKIQPIFNNKCVACHSCFNAPCQLDLTSFEGVNRGASKVNVYDFPLLKSNPSTRIGIDARTTDQWRKLGFYSVIDQGQKSLLAKVLGPSKDLETKDYQYLPEEDRVCMNDPLDHDFFKKNPRGHMPYGFPDLSEKEVSEIKTWLKEGAPSISPADEKKLRTSFHENAPEILAGWENYLNETGLKARLRSRYIYEHLFLATIDFEDLGGEHYRLIRAENPKGEPIEIATVRPYDDPEKPFHYRFQKYIRTMMEKSNMPYTLSTRRRDRWKKLFDDQPLLPGSDAFPAYGEAGSNAFKTYKRLSSKSRYQFLLDDAYYHVMTFIKGPVCRGPTALGVINDHFWVFFVDPEKDRSLEDEKVQAAFEKKMFPPASVEDKITSFANFRESYWSALREKYSFYQRSQSVFDQSFVWDGGEEKNPSARLTIYRHNDSATVLRGIHGHDAKTVWLLDYQVFEDIYYNLVAGYNVFAPIVHQLNTRLYMEISRISAEDLFLTMLNPESREKIRSGWSREVPTKKKTIGQEIVEVFTGSTADKMNAQYPYLGERLIGKLSTQEEALKIILKNYAPGESTIDRIAKPTLGTFGPFVSFFPDATLIRIEGLEEELFTLIRNKFHYNVSMLKFEENRLEPSKDTFDLIHGVGASYPNLYLDVKKSEVEYFFKELKNVNSPEAYQKFLKHYGVSRHKENFWSINEWFNKKSVSGRFDLSRYEQY
jgi:hypothetical protein